MSGDSSSKKGGEALIINDEEVRIVLVGKTGVGKSATGNTILGFKVFESKFGGESLTINCEKASGLAAGRKVSVVDTPGFFDTKLSQDNTLAEIKQCICFAAPGPHVILIVIKLGRFTEEEQKTVEMIKEVFGQMSAKYTTILFTHGDDAEDEPVEDILNGSSKLRDLIRECEGRYHVFNNKTKDPSQVTELLEKINNMVQKNGGSHYTTEMFQEVERQIQAEKERILTKNEEERHKEEEELKEKYEKMIKEQLDRSARENEERRREARENEEKRLEEIELRKELEKEIKELKERHEQEARRKAERGNIFTGIGSALGGIFGRAGAAVGAAFGAAVDHHCIIQ